MKDFLLLIALAVLLFSAGCVGKQVREGQRLFAGCPGGVDDKATLAAGTFVCKGKADPAPFAGNGRSCGSCHMPGDNFSISIARIETLAKDHPLFFEGIEENQNLLRTLGLVAVVTPPPAAERTLMASGMAKQSTPQQINEFRQIPKLIHLRDLCDSKGNCDGLGQQGDRVEDLGTFTLQAVTNHLTKTTARVPGVDFRLPTAKELKALTAYQLSTLVSDQDERK